LIPTAQRRREKEPGLGAGSSRRNGHLSRRPRECHEWIEEIAEGLAVPRDEVVRAFLEFGCEAIPVWPSSRSLLILKAQGMTLFPEGERKTLVSPSQSKEIKPG
jgi:hypothetical protein